MTKKHNVIFIDESGSGGNKIDKNSLWLSAGVCSVLDSHESLTDDVSRISNKFLRNRKDELKASMFPKDIMPGTTIEMLGEEIAGLMDEYELAVWVTGTRKQSISADSLFTASNPKKGIQAKDVARELLLERISDYADSNKEAMYLLLWDISDNNELRDFSAITSSYVDPHSNRCMSKYVIPKILGGLSHDWAEIQIADVIANFALNYVADGVFPDADINKSHAFKKHIFPRLVSNAEGVTDGIGWKFLK